jgi:hypothetical protein
VKEGRTQGLHSQAKAKGNYQARVHSGHIALMVVTRWAGPVALLPKTLKRELENNSRQPGDLTKNRQNDNLK